LPASCRYSRPQSLTPHEPLRYQPLPSQQTSPHLLRNHSRCPPATCVPLYPLPSVRLALVALFPSGHWRLCPSHTPSRSETGYSSHGSRYRNYLAQLNQLSALAQSTCSLSLHIGSFPKPTCSLETELHLVHSATEPTIVSNRLACCSNCRVDQAEATCAISVLTISYTGDCASATYIRFVCVKACARCA
jgi:hypothetical protein